MKKYIIGLGNISNSPLVFNTMQPELSEEISKLKKEELKSWELENWRKKALKDKKGNVFIPSNWIKASFVSACKHSRLVPNFATSKKETYTRYAESTFFQDTTFKCSEKDLSVVGAFMGAQGANSKTKVYKCYPKINEWKTEITMVDRDGRMTKEELRTLLDYAGQFEGIGDFRKVNCGRFEVTSINEIK